MDPGTNSPSQAILDLSPSRATQVTRQSSCGHAASTGQRIPHRQYTTSEWQLKKDVIREHYIDSGLTLGEVMKVLSQEHNFHPTSKMYKDKLKGWGFFKNCTKASMRNILQQKTVRDADGKVSTFGRDGKERDRKIKKYLRRKKKTFPEFNETEDQGHIGIGTISTPSQATLYSSDTDPSLTDSQSTPNSYEHSCPYRLGAKKFCLIEKFSSGATYQGYSFGDHSYIDIEEDRGCTAQCLCDKHDTSQAFTFVVNKSGDELEITIHSDSLLSELVTLLAPSDTAIPDRQRTINGLLLLKHYHTLHSRLDILRSGPPYSQTSPSLTLEMELLVEGLLGDGEVFKSLGHESLYERGFLGYDLLKRFQQQKPERDTAALDEVFCAVDDVEETILSPVSCSVQEESLCVQVAVDPVEPVIRPYTDFRESSQSPISVNSLSLHNIVNNYRDSPDAIATACSDFQDSLSLAQAASGGHESVVQLLLDRGADVNTEAGWLETPLCRAASGGHESVVQLLLDRGADVNTRSSLLETPLCRAASGGHESVVQLLLDRGADVNARSSWLGTPLFAAAERGHESVVQLLLNHGADSGLIDAALAGNEAMVRLLLRYRADVNTIASYGTALSVAASRGHDSVVRLLLQWGADVQTALCFLRKWGHVDSEKKLLRAVSGLHNSMGVASKLRNLRLKFVHQYILMMKAGQGSSTKCRDLAQQFRNHREAWSSSIRAMKSLCKGDRPATFCDTISFLCLARAIAESLDHDNNEDNNGHNPNSDYVNDFLRDLPRWQVLFMSDEEELNAYAETVYSMWSVVLDRGDVDNDAVLIDFQFLATSLVSRANEAFGLDIFRNNGLERSQHKWRERTGQAPPNRDSPNGSPDLPFSEVNIPQQSEPASLWPPGPPPITKTKSLGEEMGVDKSAAVVEPIVVLLIAGAVFAIVIVLLVVLRNISAGFACGSLEVRRISTLQERYRVLEIYMGLKETVGWTFLIEFRSGVPSVFDI